MLATIDTEHRLHQLADTAEDFVLYRMRMVPDLVCEYVSAGTASITGHAADELYAHPELIFERVHPDDLPKLHAALTDPEATAAPVTLRWVHPDGRVVWTASRSLPVIDDLGRLVAVEGIAYDITARHKAEEAERQLLEELARRANVDERTGLSNGGWFRDLLAAALGTPDAPVDPLAVLIVAFDRIDEVADAFGQCQGDRLLQAVADRLSTLVPAGALARLEGGEFAVLHPTGGQTASARRLAERIVAAFDEPVPVDAQPLHVDVTVGVAICSGHGDDADLLLRRARRARRAAQARNVDVLLYSEELDAQIGHGLTLLGELREAMAIGQLELHYQPKAGGAHGEVVGVEALLRWQHPEHGWVSPDVIFPLAERSGLITPLTLWAVDTAVRQIHQWRRDGLSVTVAVNIATRNLQDPSFPDDVAAILEAWGVPGSCLALELTERSVMTDPVAATVATRRLAELGVHLSIDDFGTGQSALAYLAALSFHEIKIDRSFVQDILDKPAVAAIVRTIIGLAHALGRVAVAEGVEDEATRRALVDMGCDVIQGYLISRPLPAAAIPAFVADR